MTFIQSNCLIIPRSLSLFVKSNPSILPAGGYTLEIQIPWSLMNTIPSAGKILGLVLTNNDRDLGIIKQFDWMNVIATGSYSQPNLWGSLTLSGTKVGTAQSSTKFSLNDRVQVSSDLLNVGLLNVRSTPDGTLLGTQATGALGTVIGGPTNAGGFNWWNINYDSAPDGWSG